MTQHGGSAVSRPGGRGALAWCPRCGRLDRHCRDIDLSAEADAKRRRGRYRRQHRSRGSVPEKPASISRQYQEPTSGRPAARPDRPASKLGFATQVHPEDEWRKVRSHPYRLRPPASLRLRPRRGFRGDLGDGTFFGPAPACETDRMRARLKRPIDGPRGTRTCQRMAAIRRSHQPALAQPASCA
jgi:hypothetical protein